MPRGCHPRSLAFILNPAHRRHTPSLKRSTTVSINEILRALADELAADIPDPLNQPLRLGLVWYALARPAGVEPPADVLAVADSPACHRLPVAEVRRWLPAMAD